MDGENNQRDDIQDNCRALGDSEAKKESGCSISEDGALVAVAGATSTPSLIPVGGSGRKNKTKRRENGGGATAVGAQAVAGATSTTPALPPLRGLGLNKLLVAKRDAAPNPTPSHQMILLCNAYACC